MRKGKRFTPTKLKKWQENGRGTGTGADYQPWHQITRADPGSRGRSHLINWRLGRLHHLLSDQELVAFGFATMLPNVIDLREQFPLSYDEHQVELANYRIDQLDNTSPGTGSLAEGLGVKHPVVRQSGIVAPWIMSTDLVLTLSMPNGQSELLAVSVKHDDELNNKRKCDLLKIEREYWRRQGVFWLLLTPSLYKSTVANSLRTGMLWTICQETTPTGFLDEYLSLANELHGRTLTSAMTFLSDRIHVDISTAQRIFWQAVWTGVFPIDMSRRSWASASIEMMATAQFWEQNPIASRRTICLP